MQLYFYNGQPTNYFITTDGKCKNKNTNVWLKGQVSKNGYLTYNLSLPQGKKRLYAHRMVAETYIPNKNKDRLEVNHMDGNKLNNSKDNLEWVTSRENKIHATNLGLRDSVLKQVFCYNCQKELVAKYRSVTDASLITGIRKDQISIACNKEKKTLCHGFYWSYTDGDFEIDTITTGKSKQVGKYTLNGELLIAYPSLSSAARDNECSRTHIGECCNGKIRTYKGFIWNYI